MEFAKKEMDRANTLYKQDFVSKDSVDVAVTQYNASTADLTSSKSILASAFSKRDAALAQLRIAENQLKSARADLKQSMVLAMSILMPIIYLLILGNSFQGKLQALPLVIVNKDSGLHARRLVDNLRAVEVQPKTVAIINVTDDKKAIDGVREGKYKAVLIIPPGFSKKVDLKGRPEVGLFLDNSDAISADAIESAVNGALMSINSDYVPIRERTDEVYLRNINLYRQVDYYQSLVPGVVIMAIFLGALTTGAFNLVMDRFLGIDESYLLTPLSKSHIVAGLIISGLSITTLIAILIFTVSMIITGIPLSKGIEQSASVLIIIILTTLCLLSLMFVMIGRVNHPRIIGVLSGFLNVILFFPSGAIYPIASFPGWLKAFANVNPEAYAVDALKSILFKGESITDIPGDVTFLLIFTSVMMTIAIATFKRTL
jgi:ABC-2 type transport system permease protein